MVNHGWYHSYCIYKIWNPTRIAKLTRILGMDWLPNKTILELGCGIGLVGKELQSYGAKVTFAEGRREYFDEIANGSNGAEIICIDQDEPWNLNRKFDLVLHWGVLYHLYEWERDLITSIKHGGILSLDTEVCDSDDPDKVVLIKESGYDKAIHGIGARPSAAAIERIFKKYAKSFIRYDDTDLNVISGTPKIFYDWKVGDTKKDWIDGYRRFWVVQC